MTEEQLTQKLDEFASILANDPGELEPGSPFYVANLHGADAEDVVAQLKRQISRVRGGAVYYFSGQRGTGKSTELRRLRVELDGTQDTLALLVDASLYFGDTYPIDLPDLLMMMAAGMADAITEKTGQDFLTAPGLGQRFAAWLQTEVAITEVSTLGLKAQLRSRQQSLVERIGAFKLEQRDRFQAEARDYLRDMAAFLAERLGRRQIVLIIDSLERLRGVGSQAADMFDRVVRVFDGGLDSLRIEGVQVIYAVPPYLPYLSNVKARVRMFMLASVRVFESPRVQRRQPRADGLHRFKRLLDKRYEAWADLIDARALERLMLSSGGDMRQLLRRLLADCIDLAYYSLSRLPLIETDPIIEQVIRRHEIEFEQLVVRDEYPLLADIGRTNELLIPRREDLSTVAHFFDVRAVLNYRNGEDWVDLNPLLWRLLDAQPSEGSPVLPAAPAAPAVRAARPLGGATSA